LATWNFDDVATQIRSMQGDGGGGYGRRRGGYQEDYGGDYDPEAVGGAFDGFADSPLRQYLAAQQAQAAQETPGTDPKAQRATLGLSNLADVGRGKGGTSSSGVGDFLLDTAQMFTPGGLLKGYGEAAKNVGEGDLGAAAWSAAPIAAFSAAAPHILPALRGGWNAVRHPVDTVVSAWKGVKPWVTSAAPWTQPITGAQALQTGKNLAHGGWNTAKAVAQPFTEAARTGSNAVKALMPGATAARAALTAAAPAASVAGRFLPGVGTAFGMASNAQGAITGDQGYLSDGFWGQMGEQALRTGGDLMSAAQLGPAGLIGMGATSLANVGMNTGRMVGDLYEQGQAADRVKQIQAHNADPEYVKARRARNDARSGIQRDASKGSPGRPPVPPTAPVAARPPVTPSSRGATPAGGTTPVDPMAAPGAMPDKPKPNLQPGASGATTGGIQK
jgi:hypothetical protein